jgi:hypothetical protein
MCALPLELPSLRQGACASLRSMLEQGRPPGRRRQSTCPLPSHPISLCPVACLLGFPSSTPRRRSRPPDLDLCDPQVSSSSSSSSPTLRLQHQLVPALREGTPPGKQSASQQQESRDGGVRNKSHGEGTVGDVVGMRGRRRRGGAGGGGDPCRPTSSPCSPSPR